MLVPLDRLKTNAGRRWAAARANRLVRIISGGWYWRKSRAGYTDLKESAGIYTFADAMDASFHCGPEKMVVYEFLPPGDGAPTQEPRGPATLLLKLSGPRITCMETT